MKTFNYFLSVLVVVFSILSQEGRCQVSINSDGSTPDPAAMLEIKSADKGFLLPRIDFNNRPTSPIAGLMIYVTSNGPLGNGIYVFGEEAWSKITTTIALSLGLHYGGGVIFYLDNSKQHGLIADVADLPDYYPYGCNNAVLGADGTDLGTGSSNTATIVANCPDADIAAKACVSSTQGGFTDWFLPSRDEVDSLYVHQAIIGGFTTEGWYLSSSEQSDTGAWIVIFDTGGSVAGWTSKDGAFHVRCVRSF